MPPFLAGIAVRVAGLKVISADYLLGIIFWWGLATTLF